MTAFRVSVGERRTSKQAPLPTVHGVRTYLRASSVGPSLDERDPANAGERRKASYRPWVGSQLGILAAWERTAALTAVTKYSIAAHRKQTFDLIKDLRRREWNRVAAERELSRQCHECARQVNAADGVGFYEFDIDRIHDAGYGEE